MRLDVIVSFLPICLIITLRHAESQSSIPIAELVQQSVVDAKALTIQGAFGQAINGKSFQQDVIVSFRGYQYLGYYDGDRRVCLARRSLSRGQWEVIRFKDYYFGSNDAHNTISIGICPVDGTIHLAFDHHGDTLHYRRSKPGVLLDPDEFRWHSKLFLPIQNQLEEGALIEITYPRFWQTPTGGLQFCYRRGGSGNGDRMLVDYNARRGKWEDTRQIDSHQGTYRDLLGTSDSRCSYPNGYQYGPLGKLHATWVWRESSQGSNHDLVYVYSEDRGRTWLNNKGDHLQQVPNVNSTDIVAVEISRKYGLMNTHGQSVDGKGRMHVVMWHCSDSTLKDAGSYPGEERWGPPQARRYHHYWRDLKGKWNHTELPIVAGNRPKVFADKRDNLYLIFGDRNQKTQTSDLVIAYASASEEWDNWQLIYRVAGPFVNEMLADYNRWKQDEILSVVVQDAPVKPHDRTALRILDIKFR